jgi:hypothetical protein
MCECPYGGDISMYNDTAQEDSASYDHEVKHCGEAQGLIKKTPQVLTDKSHGWVKPKLRNESQDLDALYVICRQKRERGT